MQFNAELNWWLRISRSHCARSIPEARHKL